MLIRLRILSRANLEKKNTLKWTQMKPGVISMSGTALRKVIQANELERQGDVATA